MAFANRRGLDYLAGRHKLEAVKPAFTELAGGGRGQSAASFVILEFIFSEANRFMRRLLLMVVVGSVVLGGCASSLSGSAYERRQGRTVQDVQLGTVEHVREVLLEGTKTGIGAAAGAATGSIIGGGGRGRSDIGGAVGSIAGAVIGGVAGAAVEEGATRQKGLEITVRLEGGRLIAVTQAADEAFNVGDRVRVLSGQGVTRVTH